MARKGRRVRDVGESMVARAVHRAAAKDLPPSRNNHGLIPPPSLIRLVLPYL